MNTVVFLNIISESGMLLLVLLQNSVFTGAGAKHQFLCNMQTAIHLQTQILQKIFITLLCLHQTFFFQLEFSCVLTKRHPAGIPQLHRDKWGKYALPSESNKYCKCTYAYKVKEQRLSFYSCK